MPEWRVHSLSEVYEFASGLSKPRSEFGSGFPFLSFKDVFYNRFVPEALGNLVQSSDAERKKCSIKRGDVFLTRTSETMDELGMSCVSLTDVSDATFNGFTKRLRPKDENYIVPEYAGYFFSSPRFRQSVNAMSTMSTRASLNNDMLARLEIVVPEPDEQLRIANVLKPLDDKIELNRRMNETLEEMARALFRDWFVDLGPTRRQMDGATDPSAIMGHAFPPEKAATLAALFPAKLGEHELPEGWEKRELRSGLTLNYGKALTKKDRKPGLFNVYGSGGVSGTHDTALAKGPSVIVGRKGTVGSLYWTRDDFFAIDTVFYVTSDYPMVYCHRLLETLGLETMNTDAAVPGLNRDNAYRQEFAYGGDDLINAYAEFAGTLTEKSDANGEENQTLAALRDLLLPKLMSGEIRLTDVETDV